MGLSVYLYFKATDAIPQVLAVIISEQSQLRVIGLEQWNQVYPRSEIDEYPRQVLERNEFYEANITHNLAKMASACGLYDCIWRPDENDMQTAADLIPHLESGLCELTGNPKEYAQYNPPNNWGSYEALIDFAEKYLHACKECPTCVVSVSR